MRDMTKGDPVRHVLVFAMPMILASIFQQMYNAVDSIIVGRYVGANALAAVGAAFPAMFFAMSFIMGITIGVQIIISQLFGAGEHGKLKTTFGTSLVALTIMVIVASVLGHFVTVPLLKLINTPPEILADASTYLDIIFKGLIFMFVYNLYTSMLRGIGDSRTPLYFLILASLLNIVLDYVFVVNYNMKVAGVAYATVIAQAVSAVCCVAYTYYRIPLFKLGLSDLRIDWPTLQQIFRFGIPSAIQQSIASVGSMFVQGLVNSFGTTAAAAFAAGNKIESFFVMIPMNVSNAMSTYIGQNTGAGEIERVRTGFKKVTIINMVVTGLLSLIAVAFPNQLMEIFIDASEVGVIELGVIYLSTLFLFYSLQALMLSMAAFFRGVGDMRVALAMSMTALFVRITSAYLMAKPLGYLTISLSQPIGWSMALLLAFFAYRSNRWTKFSVARPNAGQEPTASAE